MLKRLLAVLFIVTAISCPLAARAAEEPAAVPAAGSAEHVGTKTEEHGLLEFDAPSLIWTLIIFGILLTVLYKKAWGPVLAGLKGREERIRNDISQAEAARAKAEASLKDYNAQLADAEARARDIIAKATSDAVALSERIKADAEKSAKDRVERAAKDIEESRNQALREIYDQTAALSTSIAEKILRRNLNADDQRDLVAQSLDQLGAINRG